MESDYNPLDNLLQNINMDLNKLINRKIWIGFKQPAGNQFQER